MWDEGDEVWGKNWEGKNDARTTNDARGKSKWLRVRTAGPIQKQCLLTADHRVHWVTSRLVVVSELVADHGVRITIHTQKDGFMQFQFSFANFPYSLCYPVTVAPLGVRHAGPCY